MVPRSRRGSCSSGHRWFQRSGVAWTSALKELMGPGKDMHPSSPEPHHPGLRLSDRAADRLTLGRNKPVCAPWRPTRARRVNGASSGFMARWLPSRRGGRRVNGALNGATVPRILRASTRGTAPPAFRPRRRRPTRPRQGAAPLRGGSVPPSTPRAWPWLWERFPPSRPKRIACSMPRWEAVSSHPWHLQGHLLVDG